MDNVGTAQPEPEGINIFHISLIAFTKNVYDLIATYEDLHFIQKFESRSH